MPSTERRRPQLWVMASPLRFRLYELLREGPATASQLARRLGESSGTTSYHLRLLAGAGLVVEDPSLGTRRERWWQRIPQEGVLAATESDAEGRLITAHYFSMFFERDAEARRRFLTGDVDDDWHEAAFAGNWIVALTPAAAAELGERLFALVDEYRSGREEEGADDVLVSVSLLPWPTERIRQEAGANAGT